MRSIVSVEELRELFMSAPESMATRALAAIMGLAVIAPATPTGDNR